MSIKLDQIRGLLTTLDELNLLHGLVVTSADLNRTTELSQQFLVPGDLVPLSTSIGNLQTDLSTTNDRVNNLYDIVFPGMGNDIANSLQDLVNHLSDSIDAHDASAISNNTYIYLSTNTSPTDTYLQFPDAGSLAFFVPGHDIELLDNSTSSFSRTISTIDPLTFRVNLTTTVGSTLLVSASARVQDKGLSNVQNLFDYLVGRGSPYSSISNTHLNLTDSTNQITLDSDGTYTGTITMAPLTASRSYTLPNTSGTLLVDSDLNYIRAIVDFLLTNSPTNGTVNNSTIRWDSTLLQWVENANVLTDSSGNIRSNDFINGTQTATSPISQYLTQTQAQTVSGVRLYNKTSQSGVGLNKLALDTTNRSFELYNDTLWSRLLWSDINVDTQSIDLGPAFCLRPDNSRKISVFIGSYPSAFSGANINIPSALSAQSISLSVGQWISALVIINPSNNYQVLFGSIEGSRANALLPINQAAIPNFPHAQCFLAVCQGNTSGIQSLEIVEDRRPIFTSTSFFYPPSRDVFTGNGVNQTFNLSNVFTIDDNTIFDIRVLVNGIEYQQDSTSSWPPAKDYIKTGAQQIRIYPAPAIDSVIEVFGPNVDGAPLGGIGGGGSTDLTNISVDPSPDVNGFRSLGLSTRAWGSLYLKDKVTSQVWELEVSSGVLQVVAVP